MKPFVALLSGFLFVLLFNSGCGSQKKALESNIVLTSLTENAPDRLEKNLFDLDQLSLKIKTTYKDKSMQQSITINVKMIDDSLIWASVTAFNIEVARALITVDSFKLIDRINRKYYLGGINMMERYLKQSFTLSQLQDLFVGNAMYQSSGYQSTRDDVRLGHLLYSDSSVLNTLQLTEGFRVRYSVLKDPTNTREADVDYDNFQRIKKSGSLPTKVGIEITGDQSQKINLDMTYSSVSIDPIGPVSFSIPSKYEKGF